MSSKETFLSLLSYSSSVQYAVSTEVLHGRLKHGFSEHLEVSDAEVQLVGLHHSWRRNAKVECLRYKRLVGGGGKGVQGHPPPGCYFVWELPDVTCQTIRRCVRPETKPLESKIIEDRLTYMFTGFLNKIFAIFHFGAMWTLTFFFFAGKIFVQNIMKVEKTVLGPIINNLSFL